jgi:hypothetical protein
MTLPESESMSSSTAAAGRCSGGRTRAPVQTWFIGTARLLLCALREIFDESAYSRFLARHGVSSCQRAYAEFLREQEGGRARRPKCC